MPHLSPMNWILMPTLFWLLLIITMTMFWWLQSPALPSIKSMTNQQTHMSWSWSK